MQTIVWAFKFEVVDVTLSNFSGVPDACGLTNAAISNEPAIGETGDEELEEAMGFGSCYPIRTRGLNYVGSPLGRARLTLHDGANRPKPNGFARCWAVDEDGTMLDNATAVGHLVKATAEFPWDEAVASDCEKYWTYNDDDPDTSKCMWFVRGNEFLLDTSIDAARRGLRWGMDDCAWPSRGEWDGSGSAVCARTDFVTLHWTIPPLTISGSEVARAPVTRRSGMKLTPSLPLAGRVGARHVEHGARGLDRHEPVRRERRHALDVPAVAPGRAAVRAVLENEKDARELGFSRASLGGI